MRILIIGYGNTTRCDDGVGPEVVRRLASRWGCEITGLENALQTPPAQVGAAEVHLAEMHQLDFGLADAVAEVDTVLFVDAHVGGDAMDSRPVVGDPTAATTAHSLSPEALLALAEALYGHKPTAVRHTIRAESLEMGEGLTPAVAARADALADWIESSLRSGDARAEYRGADPAGGA